MTKALKQAFVHGLHSEYDNWLQTGALADCNVYRLIDIGLPIKAKFTIISVRRNVS